MTAEREIRQIQIHLPGILILLSEHLYSDYRVALRELLQNAHDSCVRRKLEDPDNKRYAPQIIISMNHAKHQLCFSDNGSGLTREEIIEYLATIGRGYTGELRDKLTAEGRHAALELVGQFGLGLLAAFIIADSVQIITRSYKDEDHGWKWHSDGNKSYALQKVPVPEVGTRVVLALKRNFLGLLDYGKITDAILTYADFLQVPIFMAGNVRGQPINTMVAPWELPADAQNTVHYKQFVYTRFGHLAPLYIIPLSVDIPGHKTGLGHNLNIRGVLLIPQSTVISVIEHGNVTVYVRRMLIDANDTELLPSWARFITGVVECPQLTPTVSRETIKKDQVYYIVQKVLEQTILKDLLDLSKTDPGLWDEIVTAHNNLIKVWALTSDEMFMHVCDIVTFKTSQGEITLKEYLRKTSGTIYYYDNLDGLSQAEALFEAQGLAVIDARFFAEEAFLKKYADTHPGTRLEQLEPGSQFIFTDIDDPQGKWDNVTDALSRHGVICRLTRFSPPEIPAVLIVSEDIKVARKARQTSFKRDKSDSTLVFIEDFINRHAPDERFDKGILHINTSSPVMRAIRDLPQDSPYFTCVVEIIYHNARLFSAKSLNAREILDDFVGINRNLETILEKSGVAVQTNNFLNAKTFTDLGLSASKAQVIVNACDTYNTFYESDAGKLSRCTGLPVKIIKVLKMAVKEKNK